LIDHQLLRVTQEMLRRIHASKHDAAAFGAVQAARCTIPEAGMKLARKVQLAQVAKIS